MTEEIIKRYDIIDKEIEQIIEKIKRSGVYIQSIGDTMMRYPWEIRVKISLVNHGQ